MAALLTERMFRRALVGIAFGGLVLGGLAWAAGKSELANWCWAGGTLPVVLGLLASMIHDLLSGRVGVDSVAFVSMSGALALGQNLAGIVVAMMYAGGNLLEDIAVARAEHDLRVLIDRAPRIAHRRTASTIEDVPIERVTIGDNVLVRAGEVVPVDGVITSQTAVIDEARSRESQFQFPAEQVNLHGAARSMPATHLKFVRPPLQVKVPTRALSGWSVQPRRRSHRLSAWQTGIHCCCCRSHSQLRLLLGTFPTILCAA